MLVVTSLAPDGMVRSVSLPLFWQNLLFTIKKEI
jgi:hypothetical protein